MHHIVLLKNLGNFIDNAIFMAQNINLIFNYIYGAAYRRGFFYFFILRLKDLLFVCFLLEIQEF